MTVMTTGEDAVEDNHKDHLTPLKGPASQRQSPDADSPFRYRTESSNASMSSASCSDGDANDSCLVSDSQNNSRSLDSIDDSAVIAGGTRQPKTKRPSVFVDQFQKGVEDQKQQEAQRIEEAKRLDSIETRLGAGSKIKDYMKSLQETEKTTYPPQTATKQVRYGFFLTFLFYVL